MQIMSRDDTLTELPGKARFKQFIAIVHDGRREHECPVPGVWFDSRRKGDFVQARNRDGDQVYGEYLRHYPLRERE